MENENRDVRDILNEAIVSENENVQSGDIGGNERKQAIDAFERFYKLRIEENKAGDEYYNNQERRELDREFQEKRLEFEMQMHQDKMQVERERLELDKANSQKDVDIQESQAKVENKKMWVDTIVKGVTLGAWIAMSLKVMKFEETGSIRSKAFTGTIPKLKFW